VAAVFGRAADVYDTAIPFFVRFGGRLVELAEVSGGESVLDVASGRGASLIPAAERVGPSGRVVGIDLAAKMVERLRGDLDQLGLVHASVRVGDAARLDVSDGEFDVALCGFTLMLLPDPSQAVAELARAVRPGGRVAVSMPTGAGPQWSFFGELIGRFAPRANRPIPPPPGPAPDFAAMLRGAGLGDIVTVDETEDFTFPDSGVWWSWVWSQGMRAFLEALPDDALGELRAAAEDRLRPLAGPDGSIPLHQGVRYVIARQPS
jgi:O-methyltransferase / aklanonic acid methyltransferase